MGGQKSYVQSCSTFLEPLPQLIRGTNIVAFEELPMAKTNKLAIDWRRQKRKFSFVKCKITLICPGISSHRSCNL